MAADLAFERAVDQLRAKALEAGYEVSPRVADVQLAAAIAEAIAKAATVRGGLRVIYSIELAIARADGRPVAFADYERAAQWWEVLGGAWGGRISPAARGLFVWERVRGA